MNEVPGPPSQSNQDEQVPVTYVQDKELAEQMAYSEASHREKYQASLSLANRVFKGDIPDNIKDGIEFDLEQGLGTEQASKFMTEHASKVEEEKKDDLNYRKIIWEALTFGKGTAPDRDSVTYSDNIAVDESDFRDSDKQKIEAVEKILEELGLQDKFTFKRSNGSNELEGRTQYYSYLGIFRKYPAR